MKRFNWLVFAAVLLISVSLASACPLCKDTIAGNSSSGANVSGGFNLSIYTMFTGFFSMLGLVGYTIYKGVKDTPR